LRHHRTARLPQSRDPARWPRRTGGQPALVGDRGEVTPMGDLKSCRVLVTPTTYGKNDPRLRTELEAAVGEVIYNQLGRALTSAELRESLPGIDGYIAGLDTIDRAALQRADRLKVIARYGGWITSISQQPRMFHRVDQYAGKKQWTFKTRTTP